MSRLAVYRMMNVRVLTPADEAAYRTILSRTSEEDRYFRFFRPVADLDEKDVRRFVTVGADLIGFIAEGDQREPLGAAHAALLPNGRAELAIVVSEDARERGVGKSLMAALITYLRDRGYFRFVAHSLHENVAFARLAHSLGMRIERAEGADVLWSLVFPQPCSIVFARPPAPRTGFPPTPADRLQAS